MSRAVDIIDAWINSARRRKMWDMVKPLWIARDILEGKIIFTDEYREKMIPEIKKLLDGMENQKNEDLLQVRKELAL